MASRMKGLALSLLIFNWISKGFNAMVSGMKKGFDNLMQYSGNYANSVQSLKNAQATLGNSFAAAFAPIVQMVIPWLVQLMNTLSQAITYVSQFIAVLGGKGTFTRAKQVQDSYNKSLGGTASAAKKAAGALPSSMTWTCCRKRMIREGEAELPAQICLKRCQWIQRSKPGWMGYAISLSRFWIM